MKLASIVVNQILLLGKQKGGHQTATLSPSLNFLYPKSISEPTSVIKHGRFGFSLLFAFHLNSKSLQKRV